MYLTLIKFRFIGNQMNLKSEIGLQLMPDGIRCGILKRLKKRLFFNLVKIEVIISKILIPKAFVVCYYICIRYCKT